MSLVTLLFTLCAALFALLPAVSAFTFTSDPPTQCDPVSFTWTGGTAPFYLSLVPVFGVPRNITIPPTAFANGRGSFSLPAVPVTAGQGIVFVMSDATGFNAGGTTNVLTVGASKGGSCDTTSAPLGFAFQLNSALQQCRPFVFSDYPQATLPVTLYGIIPGGNSFVIAPAVNQATFSWTANVTQGTNMIFSVVDAAGRQGGSSDLRPVGTTNDVSCLGGSPSTTKAPAGSQTGSAPSDTNTPPPNGDNGDNSKGGSSMGPIIGGVVGGLVLIGAGVALVFFFMKKRRNSSPTGDAASPWTGPRPGYGGYGTQQFGQNQSEVHLTYDPSNNTGAGASPYGTTNSANNYPYSPSTTGLPYDSNPFLDSNLPYQPPNANPPYQPPTPYADSYAENAYAHPPQSNTYPMQTHYQQLPPPQTYPPQRSPSNAGSHAPVPPPPPAVDPFQPTSPPIIPGSDFDPYASDAMAPPSASSQRDSMSAAQRKAAMAGVSGYKPSRFIVHTDAEDELPPPNEDEVVELPPQYSERRTPAAHEAQVAGPSGKGPRP